MALMSCSVSPAQHGASKSAAVTRLRTKPASPSLTTRDRVLSTRFPPLSDLGVERRPSLVIPNWLGDPDTFVTSGIRTSTRCGTDGSARRFDEHPQLESPFRKAAVPSNELLRLEVSRA